MQSRPRRCLQDAKEITGYREIRRTLPGDLEGRYYAGAVDLSWRLSPGWNGEAFRVYGKRASDPDYFFIAEVTSCIDDVCVYHDINVRAEVTYEYYVSAVNPDTGEETASNYSVEVYVPRPVPPPVPDAVEAVALDNSAYVRWYDGASAEDDFAFYRVYVADEDSEYLVGETDSPGFLDFLAENGRTASYFVTSVDDLGHESEASEIASCTPRPDYTGEVMYSYQDVAASAGFPLSGSRRPGGGDAGGQPGSPISGSSPTLPACGWCRDRGRASIPRCAGRRR